MAKSVLGSVFLQRRLMAMKKMKSIAVLILLGLCILFTLFWINQTYEIVQLATLLHPHLGRGVLIIMIGVYLSLILGPLYLYCRNPEPLFPPEQEDSSAQEQFKKDVLKRLRQNRVLQKEENLFTEGDEDVQIEKALSCLDAKAKTLIKNNAATVFTTTAISQNGSLDALFVIMVQMRMVYSLTRLYHQRPSLHNMMKLYLQVGATAFLARELEDMDLISDQIEPLLNTLFVGSLGSLAPVAGTVSNLITSSILQGSANAFLTLRVGLIAREYLGMTTWKEKRQIKRSASLEACGLLKGVIKDSSRHIVKAVIQATRNATQRERAEVHTGKGQRLHGLLQYLEDTYTEQGYETQVLFAQEGVAVFQSKKEKARRESMVLSLILENIRGDLRSTTGIGEWIDTHSLDQESCDLLQILNHLLDSGLKEYGRLGGIRQLKKRVQQYLQRNDICDHCGTILIKEYGRCPNCGLDVWAG